MSCTMGGASVDERIEDGVEEGKGRKNAVATTPNGVLCARGLVWRKNGPGRDEKETLDALTKDIARRVQSQFLAAKRNADNGEKEPGGGIGETRETEKKRNGGEPPLAAAR